MSSRTQLKGAKANRGKHNKKAKTGSKPQLNPSPPFIKPLDKPKGTAKGKKDS